jgi:hypothetical protein
MNVKKKSNKEKNQKYYESNKIKMIENQKKYYRDNIESVKKYNNEYYENNKNTILENRKVYSKIYYKENKDTMISNQKKYYDDNKEILIEKQKKYNNTDKAKEYRKNYSVSYREKNKEKLKKYKLNWEKNNKHIVIWRSLLKRTLRQFNNIKISNTYNMIGYDANELKNHLENLFTVGMSWSNYGEWQVDHIKLLKNFDKETSPSIVNSLSNLRPLWKTNKEINGVIYEGNLNRKKKFNYETL